MISTPANVTPLGAPSALLSANATTHPARPSTLPGGEMRSPGAAADADKGLGSSDFAVAMKRAEAQRRAKPASETKPSSSSSSSSSSASEAPATGRRGGLRRNEEKPTSAAQTMASTGPAAAQAQPHAQPHAQTYTTPALAAQPADLASPRAAAAASSASAASAASAVAAGSSSASATAALSVATPASPSRPAIATGAAIRDASNAAPGPRTANPVGSAGASQTTPVLGEAAALARNASVGSLSAQARHTFAPDARSGAALESDPINPRSAPSDSSVSPTDLARLQSLRRPPVGTAGDGAAGTGGTGGTGSTGTGFGSTGADGTAAGRAGRKPKEDLWYQLPSPRLPPDRLGADQSDPALAADAAALLAATAALQTTHRAAAGIATSGSTTNPSQPLHADETAAPRTSTLENADALGRLGPTAAAAQPVADARGAAGAVDGGEKDSAKSGTTNLARGGLAAPAAPGLATPHAQTPPRSGQPHGPNALQTAAGPQASGGTATPAEKAAKQRTGRADGAVVTPDAGSNPAPTRETPQARDANAAAAELRPPSGAAGEGGAHGGSNGSNNGSGNGSNNGRQHDTPRASTAGGVHSVRGSGADVAGEGRAAGPSALAKDAATGAAGRAFNSPPNNPPNSPSNNPSNSVDRFSGAAGTPSPAWAQNGAAMDNPAAGALTPAAAGNAAPALGASLPAQAPAANDARIDAAVGSEAFAAETGYRIAVMVNAGVESAQLQLNPIDMGPVTVQIVVQGDTAQVHLSAAQADTRLALEASMPQLASQLRDSGLLLTGGGVFDQAQQQASAGDRRAEDNAGSGRGRENGRTGALVAPGANGQAPATDGSAWRRRGVVDLVA